jgi:hypothetical protein
MAHDDSVGWGSAIEVVSHWSKPLLVLLFTKLDMVFTYGIVVTWGSRLAHLGMPVDIDGRGLQGSSG